MTSSLERRKYPRTVYPVPVLYRVTSYRGQLLQELANKLAKAVLKDISAGGVALVSTIRLPEESILGLKIDGLNNLGELPAQVVRCRGVIGGVWEMGMEFVNLPPEEIELLTQFTFHIAVYARSGLPWERIKEAWQNRS